MKRIMFVCHGNICRSPLAEYIFKDIVKKSGKENDYVIMSSATSSEEIGNPVYPPSYRELLKLGIDARDKRAVRLRREDYDKYDLFIGMDDENVCNMKRLFGGDKDNKVSKLLSYAGLDRDVDDPWYSRDFSKATDDILKGCTALFNELSNEK